MTGSTSPSKKDVDITPLLSEEVLDLLLLSASYAKKNKSAVVTPFLILGSLLSKGKRSHVIKTLDELRVDFEQLGQVLTQSRDLRDSRKYEGFIFFDPSVRQALLVSFLLAGNDPGANRPPMPVRAIHFLQAIFMIPDLSQLCLSLKFSTEPYFKILSSRATLDSAEGKKARLLRGCVRDLYEDLEKKEIFDRDEESQEVLRVLARQRKNNVLLVGEGGVGKKAVVLRAIEKARKDAGMAELAGVSFASVDIQALTPADADVNVAKILEEELSAKSPLVVLLENVEVFKTREQVSVFANFLYNLQVNTRARFILPVSPSFYSQFMQSDTIISQNFEEIRVPELSADNVVKVLRAVKKSIETFHKVSIDDAVLPDLVNFTRRFIKGEALPQKAISLLEEAASDTSIIGGKEVNKERILRIISQKSGVPVSSLTVSEKEHLIHLEDEIHQQVVGQDGAVKMVAEAVRRSRAGLKDPRKPIGSFLFLGPTGVGKTELAKALARVVFDSEKAFVRLDMSEYGESHTTQRLLGSPPGYVGYEEGGQLTNPILEHPYSLVLLDEIEKAHPKVFDVFLQVLDDGRLTDSQGRLVDFKNTIIIATSNIAQEEILEGLEKGEGLGASKEFFEQKIMPRLKEHFRPEFINRFDEIVVFRALSIEALKNIAKIKLADVTNRLLEKGIKLSIKDETLEALSKSSFDVKFGARPLVRKIREDIENSIANKIIEGNVKEGDTLEI